MKRLLVVLGAGALFGFGLVISGMSDPRNVIGFLDVTGDWRPELMAVMAGAVGVHALLLRLVRPKRKSVPSVASDSDCAAIPTGGTGLARFLDRRLIAGAAIFGVGWGISGYCPGPAIVSLGLGTGAAFAFIGAMLAGILLADRYSAGTISSGEDG